MWMLKNKKSPVACDWKCKPDNGREIPAENISRLYRHKKDFSWQGIEKEKYKKEDGDWADIARHTLIGNHAETAGFHLRYFEIAPGGCSSFETHKHEHVVIGIRGKGICVVGNKRYQMRFLDTLYIAPDAPHQLRNPFKEPFGFFCIVNSKRDRPKILK
jgi:ribulose-bisphosphate carboxylase large chain